MSGSPRENESDQQKTGILSDPYHAATASQSDLEKLRPFVSAEAPISKRPTSQSKRDRKRQGQRKVTKYSRGQKGEKIEVPTDSHGQPVILKLGGGYIPIKGEIHVCPALLREYRGKYYYLSDMNSNPPADEFQRPDWPL